MRRWSWKLGEIAGIGVYMHATFLLLIVWLAMSHIRAGDSPGATILGIIFVLAIFGCVVLHELGHALTARRFGIRTRDIILLPIGGVARLERIPEEPRQELWVAIAGPAVNVVIAAAIFLWLAVTTAFLPFGELGITSGPFLQRLMVVNLFLVVFNLLPAFPMDGGRVLRAFLAMQMPYAKATRVAASVGQALALVFGFLGLMGNPFLLFIALFVWIGAAQESSMVQARTALGGMHIRQVMLTDFYSLDVDDPLHHAVDLTLAGSQKDFPVLRDGVVVGVLTQSDLMRGLKERGEQAPVGDSMHTGCELAHPDETAQGVLMRLQSRDCHVLPVVLDGQLVGMVNLENVGEFLQIREAIEA